MHFQAFLSPEGWTDPARLGRGAARQQALRLSTIEIVALRYQPGRPNRYHALGGPGLHLRQKGDQGGGCRGSQRAGAGAPPWNPTQETQPFMLGIMTPWQEEQFRKFGGVQSPGHPQPAAAPQPSSTSLTPASCFVMAALTAVFNARCSMGARQPPSSRRGGSYTIRARGWQSGSGALRTAWQAGKTVLMDGTFGTNKWKFALTTIMVVNDQGHGVPVAFFVHSSQSAATIQSCLEALADRLGADRPSVMVIDDAAAEIAAVRESVWCAAVAQ